MQEQAQKVINKALVDGILERVMKPTDWISPGFFMPKEGGKAGLQLVTDLLHLNMYVKRPVHPFPSTRDIIAHIMASSRYFAKMDVVQGYFQILLDE